MNYKITAEEQLARDYMRERIRNFIDDQGYTLVRFASEIGMTSGALSNYFAKDAGLPRHLVPAVTNLMGMTEAQLRAPLGPDDYKQEESHESTNEN